MKQTTILFTLLLFCKSLAFGQHDPKVLKEWQDQKYSMFIHYGIYSVLGGVWEGKPVTKGLSEQIQAHAGIYSDTYAEVAKRFNPQYWNADSIVALAKKAGMRSLVITSKHHDGFCMFKTNTTDFNVVDATPYKKDIVKELSDACKRGGLRFGLYFSLIDWHFPQASPISSSNSDYITPEHVEYNKKQITELLSNYGPVSELWFDMGSQNADESRELRDLVHKLQPNCMIGSRIGNDMGDFNVMGDNQEPDYAIGVPWQSPASFLMKHGVIAHGKRGEAKKKKYAKN
ncbi:alpha-L-fucosidase [Pedobacter steynii]